MHSLCSVLKGPIEELGAGYEPSDKKHAIHITFGGSSTRPWEELESETADRTHTVAFWGVAVQNCLKALGMILGSCCVA